MVRPPIHSSLLCQQHGRPEGSFAGGQFVLFDGDADAAVLLLQSLRDLLRLRRLAGFNHPDLNGIGQTGGFEQFARMIVRRFVPLRHIFGVLSRNLREL